MYILFHKESCPFCVKVRQFASDNGVELVLADSPTGSPSRAILEKLGGKSMVPFLIDTDAGQYMYESGDIIDYLAAGK